MVQETLNLARHITQQKTSIATMEMKLTIKDVISKPTIRSVFRGQQETQLVFALVKLIVTRFCESFSFATKHTDSQIEAITIDTLENFSYDSLEDIVLFFKQCRQGKFGAVKRQVDANFIFGEWLPMYFESKSLEREKIKIDNQKSFKSQKIDLAIVKKEWEDLKKANQPTMQQQVKQYVDKITKNFDREMLENTITEWGKCEKRKPFLRIIKAKRKIIK
jgi:hypothetical protein